MMDDPNARELIQRSRSALRPTVSDRQRIEQALRAKLGPEVFSAPAKAASLAHKVGLKIAFGAAVFACVAGIIASVDRDRTQPPTAPPPAPSPQLEMAAPEVAVEQTSEIAVPPPPPVAARKVAAARPSAPATKGDSLAQEVALLSRATSALRAGDTGAALRSLDEHQQKYPRGALREERRAARAQALCSLGRISEGRAELVGLSAESPTAARADHLCRAAATGKR